ncbi:hypothetical protein HID58_043750, partial [Brassica napus]
IGGGLWFEELVSGHDLHGGRVASWLGQPPVHGGPLSSRASDSFVLVWVGKSDGLVALCNGFVLAGPDVPALVSITDFLLCGSTRALVFQLFWRCADGMIEYYGFGDPLVISLFFVSSWYDSLVPINLLGVGSRKSFGLCLSVYGIMFVSFVSELCLIKFQSHQKT